MSNTPQNHRREQYRKEAEARANAEGHATPIRQQETARVIPQDDLFAGARNGEKGDATLLYRLLHLRFCFDTSAQEWYRFNGVHWELDEEGDVYRACEQLQGLYRREQQACLDQAARAKDTGNKDEAGIMEARARHYEKACDRLNRHTHLRNVLTLAAKGRKESLAVNGRVWDQHPRELPVANGLVDLATGELAPGRPEHFIRRASPVAYDPDAQCPSWEAFLAQILDEDGERAPQDARQSRATFLQRYFGMAMVGEVIEHKVLVLAGAGGNGKGTLAELLGEAIGPDLSVPVEAELLLDQGKTRNSAGPSSDIANLRGRRLVWCSETNPGRRMDTARVKWLSGGDKLTARLPYEKRSIEFEPTHHLVLVTNHKPNVDADDPAVWRRLLVCWFRLEFVDREPEKPNERLRDSGLKASLREEMPGILRWLVQGAQDFLAFGLAVPLAVISETKEYRDEHDIIGDWLAAHCEIDGRAYGGQDREEYLDFPGAFTEQSENLFKDYKDWCQDVGIKHPVSRTMFGNKMKLRFPKWKADSIRYGGVRLREGQAGL